MLEKVVTNPSYPCFPENKNRSVLLKVVTYFDTKCTPHGLFVKRCAFR